MGMRPQHIIFAVANHQAALKIRNAAKIAGVLQHRCFAVARAFQLRPGHMMYKMRGQAWAPGYVERFIKMVGVFPVGTAVELSNEHRGVVCRSNTNFPAQPCVMVAQDPTGRAIQPQFVDLTRYIGLRITRSLSTTETESFDIPALLGGPA